MIGPPPMFLIIAIMAAIQNSKARMEAYKDHKSYANSSIYENTKSDQTKFFLDLN
ncbi:hypothetical protein S-MbCM7_193 [Synechococcus phage ACG-2014h]|uniref:Uncharacterized protein n=1 Tax=Synechococcus phage ACG-2014h TaxID=1340810 RepID=V5USV2_9CAUD|nr:hypothetical protein S-MbCM7_193 [Synechococcus phage ACG-2014h]AHB80607.1 hypothetical protein S-MbCM7_193 [Synechococcus phage ACG-2014h]